MTTPLSTAADQPRELGLVRWHRSFDAALAAAHKDDKPVLVLFDEVPGCHTCVSYGESVLSHPVIVDAAETLFVPVAVYNNVEGPDRVVLRSFNEPEWNNPVVRFIDSGRAELAPRLDGEYTPGALAARMVESLESSGREAPPWLRLVALESLPTERAVFAMHCFWEGEAKLGALGGVVSTRTGFVDNLEVVEVVFAPSLIAYESLLAQARSMECASRVYTTTANQARVARAAVGDLASPAPQTIRPSTKDDKHALRRSDWRFVPMTETQAARVNAAIAAALPPAEHLAPRQLDLHAAIRAHPDAGWTAQTPGEPIVDHMRNAEQRAASLRRR